MDFDVKKRKKKQQKPHNTIIFAPSSKDRQQAPERATGHLPQKTLQLEFFYDFNP